MMLLLMKTISTCHRWGIAHRDLKRGSYHEALPFFLSLKLRMARIAMWRNFPLLCISFRIKDRRRPTPDGDG
ncbi:hypothetical protein COCNU_scaffold045056G000020 [Cocos nucifera]|nr:hypothetical protein [Cocos nucifera]